MPNIVAFDDKSEIWKAWGRTFKASDPFIIPFQPQIEACLYFPFTDGTCLAPVQYRAVTEAARALGERGFFLSETESDDFIDRLNHWWCEFPTYEQYVSQCGLETSLYSMELSWGAIASHEWHALVGGPQDFIRHVDQIFPAWRDDVIQQIDEWEGPMERRMWCPKLLIDMLEYWKKYPGDEWVETVTAKLDRKLTGGL